MNIINAKLEHLDALAVLFNEYRMFYQKDSNPDAAMAYLKARLSNEEAIVFLAQDATKKALGFVLLYPSFSSLSMGKIYVLNDLYVEKSSRGKGISHALMRAARDFARENHAVKIILKTSKDNQVAQSLYKSEDYHLETRFLTYELDL